MGGLVQAVASGGTGAYRFGLASAPSGAVIDARTGSYVAGDVGGVEDVITVTDDGCLGDEQVSVWVTAPMAVTPEAATLPPDVALALRVTGGSGSVACALESAESGGSISADCAYRSGLATGVDRVAVLDTETGVRRFATISVDAAHALQVAGWGGIVLPLGSPWRPEVTGGTGVWELTVASGPLVAAEGQVEATSVGDGVVRISDALAPELFLDVPVSARALRSVALQRDGERSGEGVAVGLGDVDGDGYPDAALGFIEMSLEAWTAGGVALYAGGPDGLEPTPVRVLSGWDREQTFGRSVAIGDLDGDGLAELIVGADRADRGATNNGVVAVYSGVEGSFFSAEPTRILAGPNPYGRLGSSLAVCDFNGDGWLDLAVGAKDDADENVAVPADKQGAVHVFLGDAGRLGDEADFMLHGVVPDGSGWVSEAGMNLGTSVAAGDLDGDGLCDLVAGAPDAGGEDGAVLVWRGSAVPGEGLVREPAAFLSGPDGGELGRRLAVGDVDGDGRDELWVSAWTADLGARGAGGVWGFPADALPLDGGAVDVAAATWVRLGTSSYERLGTSLALSDLDGDGLEDVVIGSYRDEVGSGVNEGTVTVFWGADVAAGPLPWDATGADAAVTIEGVAGQDRLGQAVGVVGDLTGDGVADLLALAGYDSALGVEAGAPYFLPVEEGATPERLALPGVAAGHGIGASVAWMDVDGDGQIDLLSSAADAGDPEVGANAGQLQVWSGGADGVDAEGRGLLGRHETHDATDRFAHAVRNIGDFDGDGYADLAVVARKDSRPSAFDPAHFDDPTGCAGARTQAGAVYVYRGTEAGLEDDPAFVYFGPEAYGLIQQVEGGFDRDGDGYQDLVVSSTAWDVGGGFAFVYGGPASPDGRTRVRCTAEVYADASPYDRLGSSLAPLGDLDGDGCDEVMVGASGEESLGGATNQGVLRLLYGTCGGSHAVTTLAIDVVGAEAGSALASGADLDEDGLWDLAVGGSALPVERTEVGGAWFVSGARILALEPDAHAPGSLPAAPQVHAFLDTDAGAARVGVRGTEAASGFGSALAFLPPNGSEPWRLAVGAPLSSAGGTSYAGAVWLYRWGADAEGAPGFDALPWGLVVGDAPSGASGLGSTVRADLDVGAPGWVVGAPRSDVADLDGGAVLLLDW